MRRIITFMYTVDISNQKRTLFGPNAFSFLIFGIGALHHVSFHVLLTRSFLKVVSHVTVALDRHIDDEVPAIFYPCRTS